jgi:hypothetical protein
MLAAGIGCARTYRLPMTATDLARQREPDALVVYLGQRGADPDVCGDFDAGVGPPLVAALRAGRVAPTVWRACLDRLLEGADRRAAVTAAIADGYAAAPEGPVREVLGRAYLERPPGGEATDALRHAPATVGRNDGWAGARAGTPRWSAGR